MKTTIIFLLAFFCSGIALSQTEKQPLPLISWCKEIKLSQTNEKCGEWGGDTETIRVFQKNCTGEIFIEYKKQLMDCNDPIAHYKRKDYDEIKTTLTTQKERELIKMCVQELIQMKLSNPISITHSGIVNKIISNDSTLVIRDYPSTEWNSFKKLTELMVQK